MSPTAAQVALHDPNALLHARITAGVAAPAGIVPKVNPAAL